MPLKTPDFTNIFDFWLKEDQFKQIYDTYGNVYDQMKAYEDENFQNLKSDLINQTKIFRKLSNEEKINNWIDLIKKYQSALSIITKRSLFAEEHYKNFYSYF